MLLFALGLFRLCDSFVDFVCQGASFFIAERLQDRGEQLLAFVADILLEALVQNVELSDEFVSVLRHLRELLQ